MNKIFSVVLFLTILLAAGCNAFVEPSPSEPTAEAPPDDEGVPTKKPAQKGDLVKSDLARETNPQVSTEDLQIIADDTSRFAAAFYQQIRSKEGNIIFSPFSISLALSMTLAGAESATEEAMMNALQYSSPEDRVHPAFNALLLAISESEKEKPEDSEGSEFTLN
ncbi:MAG: serpin family protein, partial [Brevefilum sp.]